MHRNIIGIAATILLLIGALNLWLNLRHDRIYVVDNKALFEGFEMTRHYEQKLDDMETSQTHVLDSLDRNIVRMRKALENDAPGKDQALEAEMQRSIVQYRNLSSRFRQALSEATGRFDRNIWDQITPLIQRFARERGHEFLFGKGSMDDLYHYPEARDVTSEALEYINKHYDEATP